MGVNQEIIDVDDFESIYYSRLEDYRKINSIKPQRRILTMHMGGIVLECLVKYMVITKKNIIKVRKNTKNKLLYDENGYNNLINKKNASNDEYANNAFLLYGKYRGISSLVGVGHDYPSMVFYHLQLNDSLIQNDIENTYNPFNFCDINVKNDKHDECFIDLRYYDEDNELITEDLFNKWKSSFDVVHKQLENELENLLNYE